MPRKSGSHERDHRPAIDQAIRFVGSSLVQSQCSINFYSGRFGVPYK